MKKLLSVLIWLLFILTLFFPVGKTVLGYFGCDFKLIRISGFAFALAALSACTVILDVFFDEKLDDEYICELSAVIAPLSLINAVFYIFVCHNFTVFICIWIYVGCSFLFALKHGKPLKLRNVALGLTALMVIPISLFCFFMLTFGNIGQNTVVQTVESPSGEYYAEVIDSDQGALGGDTIVQVREKNVIDLFLFKIEKKPRQVYIGDWGEFNNMEIHWKDDGCLVINAVEYEIKRFKY